MNNTIPNCVLIVGRGLYALQLIRAYHHAGTKKVYLATTTDLDFARASLSLTKSFIVPKPNSNEEITIQSFSNSIQRIIFEYDVDLVVPAAEEGLYVSYLAPKWLTNGCKAAIFVCPFNLMDLLHDKYRFQKLCESKGTKIPRTELAQTKEQILKFADEIGKETGCNQIVIKPIYTRGGRSMWILDLSRQNIEEFKGEISIDHPYAIQQFISGQEYSSYSVISLGKIVAHVCYRCEFPVKGFSTVRITVRKPAILDWVHSFIQNVDSTFSGQLGFDFIETYNGSIFALECNPRATNGISFFSCDSALSRGLCQTQFSAALKASRTKNEAISTPTSSTIPPLPKSPSSSSVFSSGLNLGSDILEPRPEIVVATILPALTLLKGNPKLLRTLRIANADIEWPSDPFPLCVALLKSLRLLSQSIPKLLYQGEKFATLAAQATEDELVKYDCKPKSSSSTTTKQTRSISTSSLSSSSWENDLIDNNNNNNSTRILVTGASGFLGSRLILKLIELNSNSNSNNTIIATGRNQKHFEEAIGGPVPTSMEFVPCDLIDRSAVKSLVKNVDVVIHCAAKCTPWGHLEDFMQDNVEVTRFLLEACAALESSVNRFIHVSSPSIAFAVDESQARLFVNENEPLPPKEKQANYYSFTKMLAEQLVKEFANKNKPNDKPLCILTIRPRAIFGEGDRALFPRIVSRLREGRLPQIGDGNTVVDLTHVDNVVHALICAMKAPKEICNGQVYNITDCEPQKLWKVIENICDTLEMPKPKFYVPRIIAYKLASMMEFVYSILLELGISEKEPLLTRYAVNVLSMSQTLDCSHAREHLGYNPIIKTEDGLKSFLNSIREREVKLPCKKTNPHLILIIIPFIKSFLICVGISFCLSTLLPQFRSKSSYLYLICMSLFFIGEIINSRNKGFELLKEESRRRRNRANLAMLSQKDNNLEVFEKGKRSRPWRNIQNNNEEEERFLEAVRAAPTLAMNSNTKHLLLDLYGLFKQQKDGDCNIEAPNVITQSRDFTKWKAWNDRKGLSNKEAKEKYIELIEEGFDLVDEGTNPEEDKAKDLEFAQKEKIVYHVKIDGVGRFLPNNIVSTIEVEKLCEIQPGWSSLHNVGVKNRRWAEIEKGETNSFMAARAIEEACTDAGISTHDLDLIINASASNERILPDGSCLVKRALNLENSPAACFSIHATCLSFVVAMDLASSLIETGRYRKVAIVSSEISSVACNFSQPESALLLGDGAAACILSSSLLDLKSSCIHRVYFENHCKGLESATLRTGTLKHPKNSTTKPSDHLFDMNGPKIVEAIREVGISFLEKVRPGLSTRLPYDYDLVVPHQPSGAAMDILAAHGWPREQTINILSEYGNCVAASTGMALYEAIKSGRLQRGMKFIMCGTGGGITLGAIVLTY